MNKTFFLLSLAFFCGAIFYQISFADEIGPEDKILTSGGNCTPVLFEHRKHQKRVECNFCHHSVDDNGKRINYTGEFKAIKCKNCHNRDMDSKKFDSVKEVSHNLCRKCHQDESVKVSCPICHNYSNKL